MNRKTGISFIFICYFALYLFAPILPARPDGIIRPWETKGIPGKGITTGRETVFIEKQSSAAEINAFVPKAGNYQLVAYVHHNERSVIPCIYAEVVDSNGKVYGGYHKIENIWYLNKDDPGRWFFISLCTDPYWNLPSGRLVIRLWSAAKDTSWSDKEAFLKGKIAVSELYLIPVTSTGTGDYLPWVMSPEIAKGNWKRFDYYPRYATNLIQSQKHGDLAISEIDVPVSGYYQVYISLISPEDNNLSVNLKKMAFTRDIQFEIKGKNTWSSVITDPIYLENGSYAMQLKHNSRNSIMVDYIMLLPVRALPAPG